MRTAVIELGSRRCRLLVADLSRKGTVRNMVVGPHRQLYTDVVAARHRQVPAPAAAAAAAVVSELLALPAASGTDRALVVPTGAVWRTDPDLAGLVVGQTAADWWWPQREQRLAALLATADRVEVDDPVVLHVDEYQLLIARAGTSGPQVVSLPAGPLRFLQGMPPQHADLRTVARLVAVFADRHPDVLRWVRTQPLVVTGLAAGVPMAVRALLGRWSPDPLLPYKMSLRDLRRVVDRLRDRPPAPAGVDETLWETAPPAASAVVELCRLFPAPPPQIWFDDMTVAHVALRGGDL